MIKVTVKGKTHVIDMVTTRAIHEMGPALEMFAKIQRATQAGEKGEPVEDTDLAEAMNVLLDWYVTFCGKRFTRDDLLDGYPADSIIRDISLAMQAVQNGVTGALAEFPTTAGRRPQPTPEATVPTIRASAALLWLSMRTALTKAFRRK